MRCCRIAIYASLFAVGLTAGRGAAQTPEGVLPAGHSHANGCAPACAPACDAPAAPVQCYILVASPKSHTCFTKDLCEKWFGHKKGCAPACEPAPVCAPQCPPPAPACGPVCVPVRVVHCAPPAPVCKPAPVCVPAPVCYKPAPVCAPACTPAPVCAPACTPAPAACGTCGKHHHLFRHKDGVAYLVPTPCEAGCGSAGGCAAAIPPSVGQVPGTLPGTLPGTAPAYAAPLAPTAQPPISAAPAAGNTQGYEALVQMIQTSQERESKALREMMENRAATASVIRAMQASDANSVATFEKMLQQMKGSPVSAPTVTPVPAATEPARAPAISVPSVGLPPQGNATASANEFESLLRDLRAAPVVSTPTVVQAGAK